MTRLVETRKIDADAFTVYDCIRDDRMIQAWTPKIERIEWEQADVPERLTGARAHVVMRGDGDRPEHCTLTITRSRVPDRVVHVWSRDGLDLTMRFDLTPMDQHTCLTVTIEPEQMDLPARMSMVFGGTSALKKCLTDRMDRLSRLAQDAAKKYRLEQQVDFEGLQSITG